MIRQWLFARKKPPELPDGRQTALKYVPVREHLNNQGGRKNEERSTRFFTD
jgi:hypothetical protein